MTEAEGIHVHPERKLGKRPEDKSRKRAQFSVGMVEVPDHPIAWDSTVGLTFPMDGNDVAGDCVVAEWDHYRQTVKALLGKQGANLSMDEIWDLYKTQNPDFDPNGSPSKNGPGSNADGGMNIQQFLEELLRRQLILGFARVDETNKAEVQAALYLSLALCAGATLTMEQVGNQFDNKLWDYVPGDPDVGGHCFTVSLYAGAKYGGVTWGTVVGMTPEFLNRQVDELWFVLMQEHVDHPDFWQGYDLAKLADAVAEITDGKVAIPTTPPDPTPTPQPQPPSGVVQISLSDRTVIHHLTTSAKKAGLTLDEWARLHFRRYFKIG